MFSFLCVWLGMVLNQGQLSIVVSDWESYLGSFFPPPSVWDLVLRFVCREFAQGSCSVVVFFIVFVLSKVSLQQ